MLYISLVSLSISVFPLSFSGVCIATLIKLSVILVILFQTNTAVPTSKDEVTQQLT